MPNKPRNPSPTDRLPPGPEDIALGQALDWHMTAAGLAYTELGRRTGKHENRWYELRDGKVSWTFGELLMAADALEINLMAILARSELIPSIDSASAVLGDNSLDAKSAQAVVQLIRTFRGPNVSS